MSFIFKVMKSIQADDTAWTEKFGSPDPVAEFKIDTFDQHPVEYSVSYIIKLQEIHFRITLRFKILKSRNGLLK